MGRGHLASNLETLFSSLKRHAWRSQAALLLRILASTAGCLKTLCILDPRRLVVSVERVRTGWGETHKDTEWGKDLWISYIWTHQAWTNTVVIDRHSWMSLIPRTFHQVAEGLQPQNDIGLTYRELTWSKWFLVTKCIPDMEQMLSGYLTECSNRLC